jgi:DinB superfamily
MPAAAPTELRSILALVDEAFDARAWHGPTLRRAVSGVTPAQAAWRPAPGRHNIVELAAHAAYWKHEVRRRLRGGRREPFPLNGHNWVAVPDGSWDSVVRLLVDEHKALRATIARMSPRDLARRVRGRDTAAFTIRGIAAHDLYHAGQIQLLRRLQRERRRR